MVHDLSSLDPFQMVSDLIPMLTQALLAKLGGRTSCVHGVCGPCEAHDIST